MTAITLPSTHLPSADTARMLHSVTSYVYVKQEQYFHGCDQYRYLRFCGWLRSRDDHQDTRKHGEDDFVKRVLAALILALGAAGGVTLKAASASANTTVTLPSFCAASGPIPATAISSSLDLSKCPIQGRQLFLPAGSDPVAAGVNVPPPGQAVTNYTLTKTGEYQLTAANINGHLTVSESRAVGSPARSASLSAATDPACSETAYN